MNLLEASDGRQTQQSRSCDTPSLNHAELVLVVRRRACSRFSDDHAARTTLSRVAITDDRPASCKQCTCPRVRVIITGPHVGYSRTREYDRSQLRILHARLTGSCKYVGACFDFWAARRPAADWIPDRSSIPPVPSLRPSSSSSSLATRQPCPHNRCFRGRQGSASRCLCASSQRSSLPMRGRVSAGGDNRSETDMIDSHRPHFRPVCSPVMAQLHSDPLGPRSWVAQLWR